LRKSLFAAFVAVLVLGISAVAFGAFQQTFTQSFTVTKPNKLTGINTLITSTDDAGAKPKEVSRVIIKFNKGTKFNYNVPAICKLTAEQIAGASDPLTACPAKSKVGTGSAEADAAPLIPSSQQVLEDITAFNTTKGIYFVLTDKDNNPSDSNPGQLLVIKGVLSGATLTTDVPVLNVAGTSVVLTKFELSIKKVSKKTKKNGKTTVVNYITTPNKCSGGKWTNVSTFQYRDGSPSVERSAVTNCKKK
jgi:hypothetical protein